MNVPDTNLPAAERVTRRLQSLDALRGFDMFWIICGEGIFHGLKTATATQPFTWMSDQLHHTPWNGFTFYDMIFPLFIFIAGVSMPFSFGNQLEKAGINKSIAKKNIYISLLKRTFILLFLGMVVNGLLKWQGYENTRFASVLGRIALSCFFAAIIYLNSSTGKQITWFVILMMGYWAAMMLIPVPGYGAVYLRPMETWKHILTGSYYQANCTALYMTRKDCYQPYLLLVLRCWVYLQDNFCAILLKNGVCCVKEWYCWPQVLHCFVWD